MILSLASCPSIAFYPPGATFGPRHLRDYEFVWMVEGNAQYFYRKGNRQQEIGLPQGSLLLCRPPCIDQFIWDKERNTRHGFFHFSIEEGEPALPPPSEWPLIRQVADGDLLDTLFGHLITWSPQGSASLRDVLASTLLTAFLTGETEVHSVSLAHWPDPVQRAITFMAGQIEKDAAARLELKTIASAACVSPEYLCRIFQKTLGNSPLAMFRLMRLERAALLLSRSNYSVARVAELTGFQSPFHFSRVFKGVYGLTPRETQRLAAEGKRLPPSTLQRLHNGMSEPKEKAR